MKGSGGRRIARGAYSHTLGSTSFITLATDLFMKKIKMGDGGGWRGGVVGAGQLFYWLLYSK